MKLKVLTLATFLLLATPALAQAPAPQAQAPQPPVSISILQNMVGALAGQNAQMAEQIQTLNAQNLALQKELAEAKKPKPEPKK